MKKQVVITGTGRAGTTFLIEILTHLGLDTGFSPDKIETHKDKISNAGLEFTVGEPSGPHIVKDPSFVDYAEEILVREDIEIEHIFIPIRDISAVASGRRANQKEHYGKLSLKKKLQYLRKPYLMYGGLLYTQSSREGIQESILIKKLFDLLLMLAKYHIPVTFIQFPFFVSEPRYLYQKLTPILKKIAYSDFLNVFEALADPLKPRGFGSKNKKST